MRRSSVAITYFAVRFRNRPVQNVRFDSVRSISPTTLDLRPGSFTRSSRYKPQRTEPERFNEPWLEDTQHRGCREKFTMGLWEIAACRSRDRHGEWTGWPSDRVGEYIITRKTRMRLCVCGRSSSRDAYGIVSAHRIVEAAKDMWGYTACVALNRQ